ncbi:SDR family NAD(P)-dependent oxidoreductase [Terasakiella pusilla]|uniref:SDR family NAD(P)-dependent oxidoreductase n=1 Tax=Terasakiella pusilla TaxID=64973 RepID=UPI003AA7C53C
MLIPKSILITGATSGIGAELAKQYSDQGVHLYLCARREDLLTEIALVCREKGATVSVFPCDVTDRAKMRDWILACDQKTPLDLVIANAGLGGAESLAGEFGEPEEVVRKLFAVNCDGVLNTVEPIKPIMVERKQGQIAIVSSLASYFGLPDSPAYCASKAAARIYGEALRPVLKPHGVAVNVICPGFVKTPMSDQLPFSLPFLLSVEKSVTIMRKRLAKNHARISFPAPLAFGSWFGMILPASISGTIMGYFRKFPKA